MLQLLNATEEGFNAVKEELRNLRLACLQNRYALDLHLAASGGVCALIKDTCCTFVPAKDGEEGNLTRAIKHLTNLRDRMKKEAGISGDWFSGLEIPSWFWSLIKLFAPIFVILVVLLCCIGLIITCCKKITAKMTMMSLKSTSKVSVQRMDKTLQLQKKIQCVFDQTDFLDCLCDKCQMNRVVGEHDEQSAL